MTTLTFAQTLYLMEGLDKLADQTRDNLIAGDHDLTGVLDDLQALSTMLADAASIEIVQASAS